MALHTTCKFSVEWPKGLIILPEGSVTSIIDLCAAERIFLAFAGSSANGWAIYAVDAIDRTRKQQISPLFHKDFGDTRAAMIEACRRAYGDDAAPVVNLGSEHPEECFRWRTVD